LGFQHMSTRLPHTSLRPCVVGRGLASLNTTNNLPRGRKGGLLGPRANRTESLGESYRFPVLDSLVRPLVRPQMTLEPLPSTWPSSTRPPDPATACRRGGGGSDRLGRGRRRPWEKRGRGRPQAHPFWGWEEVRGGWQREGTYGVLRGLSRRSTLVAAVTTAAVATTVPPSDLRSRIDRNRQR
jgi:hypothetical protein